MGKHTILVHPILGHCSQMFLVRQMSQPYPGYPRVLLAFCARHKKGDGTLLPPAVLLYLFQRPSGISGLAGRISHWENRLYAYQLVVTNQVFESASVEIMMITSVYLFWCI